MGASRRVRVFLNAGSGAGEVSAARIREGFAAHGCDCHVTPLKPGMDWDDLSRQDDQATIWVAAGGDGTVNAVASSCAKSGRAMGVLPVGTLNHFARDLGLPQALDDAIRTAAEASARPVDAAEGNGIVFVNNSSLGMYPAIVIDRDRMRKQGGPKWWAMVKASARAFLRFRCLEVEYEMEGRVRQCRTAMLFVGNNRYEMEGGKIGQRTRLDEGVLSVALIAGSTRAGMLRVFAGALLGRSHRVGELQTFEVKTFKVQAHGRRRLRVSFDGEVKRMLGPIEYRVQPSTLNVITPEVEPR